MNVMGFNHYTCFIMDRDDENPVNEGSVYDPNECSIRTVLDTYTAPTNEREVVEHLLDACVASMDRLSTYGSPYNSGFNSLIECMRYEHSDFMRHILKSNSNAELLKQYHSEIDLPPSPGCEVNWMWFLSAFEDVKRAQVSE